MKYPVLLVNQWWIPSGESKRHNKRKPRHIFAYSNGKIIYGNGGDKHYECGIKTFKAWRAREKAELGQGLQISHRDGSEAIHDRGLLFVDE